MAITAELLDTLPESVWQTLTLAERRNKSIPQLFETNQVYKPARRPITVFNNLLAKLLIQDVQVAGTENLELALQLEEKGQGPLIVVGNHLSDADTSARRYGFTHIGYAGFADRLVYPAGLKMDERWYTRFSSNGENRIVVATPLDLQHITNTRSTLEQTGRLTPELNSLLKDYKKNCESLNLRALRTLKKLTEADKLLSIYPESTRSRTGLLIRAPEAVSAYFPEKQGGIVLPVVAEGPDQLSAADKPLTLTRFTLKMYIGKPYPVAKLWEKPHYPSDISTRQLCIDRVMARLAFTRPELTPERDYIYYLGIGDPPIRR